MKKKISIVMPVYNCAGTVKKNIDEVLTYLKGENFDYEFIVVDDGSSDGTENILTSFSENQMKVIINKKNMGKGFSVRRGMLEASGDYIIFFDADLSYPVHQVNSLIDSLEQGADVAIGTRVHKDSRFILHCNDMRYIYRRHLLSRSFNYFRNMALFKEITDSQCGFKGFTREASKHIFSKLKSNDFSFDLELLFLAQKANYIIQEIPVTVIYHGDLSTVGMFQDSFTMFYRIIATWYYYLTGQYN